MGNSPKEYFMKKNKIYVLGMLAMVLAFGLILTGCATNGGNTDSDIPNRGSSDSDVPKAIKFIGDFPAGFEGERLYLFPSSTRPDSWPPVAIGWGVNSEGNLRLVKWYPGIARPNIEDWTETGRFYILMQCQPPKDPSKDGSNYVYSEDGINPTLVDIKDAVTTIDNSKFIYLNDFTAG